MKPLTLLWLFCSMIIIFSAFILGVVFAEGIINQIIVIAIIFGMILFVIIWRRKRKIVVDERDIKIGRAANSYSWFLSYTAIAALIMIEVLDIVDLSVMNVLIFAMFFMLLSRLFTRAILMKLGDVS